MKGLVEYINERIVEESKNFRLSDDERRSVADLLGFLTGNIGDDETIKQYSEYWDALSDNEQDQMNDLYDVFDNESGYHYINRSIIRDDVDLLLNFLNWVDENDLWGDYEYDGPSAIDRMEQ